MKAIAHYPQSIVLAVSATFLTFFFMSLLIETSATKKRTIVEFGDFTKVRDIKQPNVKDPTPPKALPKQEKVSQPPAAPKLDIQSKMSREETVITQGDNSKLNPKALLEGVAPIGNPMVSDLGSSSQLIAKFIASPQYPYKQMQNKVEGYVTVEFVVNELGQVVNAIVVDSKPKRVFDRAALSAIYKSKFNPVKVNGKEQTAKAIQTFEFKLPKD